MDNLLMMKEDLEALELSKVLGFDRTLFLDKEFVLVNSLSKREILKEIKAAKGKLTVVKVENEETLRFVLEKTSADIVFGQEKLNYKDSVHFRRSGLNQVLCKLAASKGKIIAFSFNDLLESKDLGKLMGRMMFNLKLCKKYKVKTFFGNFSKEKMEMRDVHTLQAFFRVLGGNSKVNYYKPKI